MLSRKVRPLGKKIFPLSLFLLASKWMLKGCYVWLELVNERGTWIVENLLVQAAVILQAKHFGQQICSVGQ